jgi:hypothetical protein
MTAGNPLVSAEGKEIVGIAVGADFGELDVLWQDARI